MLTQAVRPDEVARAYGKTVAHGPVWHESFRRRFFPSKVGTQHRTVPMSHLFKLRRTHVQRFNYGARYAVSQREGGRSRLHAVIDWQISEGTNGLVPVGTTGESPTLDHDEHKRVIELAVLAAKKRVPVLAAPARIRPMKPSSFRNTPRKLAPTPCSSSRPITTSLARKDSISTSRRSTTQSISDHHL